MYERIAVKGKVWEQIQPLRFALNHVCREVPHPLGDYTEEFYELVDEHRARQEVRHATGVRDVEFELPGMLPLYGEVPFSRVTVRLDEHGVPVAAYRG